MQYLGVLRGAGTLACGDESMGRAEFDVDGFMTRPGEVVASGEVRMAPDDLNRAFGKMGLVLTTDDGRVISVRFSGKRVDPSDGAAHADLSGGLRRRPRNGSAD